ncbi:MAG: (d)CMP kinase, partial [Clostridia bacterium]|nr:(d)CMP kinase [Clostridia bacterium]
MISVAIDGPAGAGKSTISKQAAKTLGFIYVDTGALYRAVGLKFSRLGFDTELNCDIEKILETTTVDIRFVDGVQHVFLDDEDVSELIRTPEASMMASAVSAKPPVRAFLLEMQRKLARENNVLMDGRDIGTVVLPDATVKIFLTASA